MSKIIPEQRYRQFSHEKRCRLRGMREMSLSISEIARRMDRRQTQSGANSSATGAPNATGWTAPNGAPGRVSCAARRSCASPTCVPTPRTVSPWAGVGTVGGRVSPADILGADRGADGARRLEAQSHDRAQHTDERLELALDGLPMPRLLSGGERNSNMCSGTASRLADFRGGLTEVPPTGRSAGSVRSQAPVGCGRPRTIPMCLEQGLAGPALAPRPHCPGTR
jgi:hypothetical protein